VRRLCKRNFREFWTRPGNLIYLLVSAPPVSFRHFHEPARGRLSFSGVRLDLKCSIFRPSKLGSCLNALSVLEIVRIGESLRPDIGNLSPIFLLRLHFVRPFPLTIFENPALPPALASEFLARQPVPSRAARTSCPTSPGFFPQKKKREKKKSNFFGPINGTSKTNPRDTSFNNARLFVLKPKKNQAAPSRSFSEQKHAAQPLAKPECHSSTKESTMSLLTCFLVVPSFIDRSGLHF